MTTRKKKPPVPAISKEQLNHIGSGAIKTPILASETAVAYLREPFRDCLDGIALELVKQVNAVNQGDLSGAEGLLVAQAHTLNLIYNRLARRAMDQEYMNHMESFLKLALRAQMQCARTLEILSTIKNPPNVSFVKQANIAHNQQVNNVPQADQPSAIQPPVIDSTPQLEHTHGEYLDTGTATTAIRNDQEMETVAKIHRSKDRQG